MIEWTGDMTEAELPTSAMWPDHYLVLNECYHHALYLWSIMKWNHLGKKKKAQERGIFQADLELFLREKRSKKQPEALQVSMTKALLWCPRRPWPQKMLHKVEKSDSTSIWWLINPPANNNHVPFLSPAFLFLLRLLLRSSYLFLSEITSINLISK